MKYEHIVYFDKKDGQSYIAVDYLFEDGRRSFQTHYALPDVQSEDEGYDLMARVAKWPGNSVLIGLPNFRCHIGIEERKK